jgi:hypothetical protein
MLGVPTHINQFGCGFAALRPLRLCVRGFSLRISDFKPPRLALFPRCARYAPAFQFNYRGPNLKKPPNRALTVLQFREA